MKSSGVARVLYARGQKYFCTPPPPIKTAALKEKNRRKNVEEAKT